MQRSLTVLARTSSESTSTKAKGGFTLIEVMVAVSIFTIIMVLGVSALLSTTAAASQSRADRRATDSLSVFFEQFSRTVRTGQGFVLTGNTQIAFTTQPVGGIVYCDTYQFIPGSGTIPGRIEYQRTDCLQTVIRTETVPSIGSGVSLDDVVFDIPGNEIINPNQPLVRVVVRGTATDRKKTSSFTLQTAVSPRILQLGGSNTP
jgi:prepilin-type N-terminal cleavage/methylation domain-containing protein